MTTSGSFDFNLTRNEIITAALRKLGVLATGQTPTAEQIANGAQALNVHVKSLRAIGVFLWDISRNVQDIQDASIVLGDDGTDYQCFRQHVATIDNRPVSGDLHQAFWRRLGTNTGPAWVVSTTYVSSNEYDIENSIFHIENVRRIDSGSIIKLERLTREQYLRLNNKVSNGQPSQYYFKAGNLEIQPKIFLHPNPDSSTDYVIEYDTFKYPENFDSENDNPDFSQTFLSTLIYGTAKELFHEYPALSQSKINNIISAYTKELDIAMSGDEEWGDFSVEPQFTE